MITGISTIEEWEFVSKLDRATERNEQTIFKFGALDAQVRAYISDVSSITFSDVNSGNMVWQNRNGTVHLEAVRFGLRGVENFRFADGKDVPLPRVERLLNGRTYHVLSDEALSAFDMGLIVEMGQEILKKNTMQEQERKN